MYSMAVDVYFVYYPPHCSSITFYNITMYSMYSMTLLTGSLRVHTASSFTMF